MLKLLCLCPVVIIADMNCCTIKEFKFGFYEENSKFWHTFNNVSENSQNVEAKTAKVTTKVTLKEPPMMNKKPIHSS